MRRSLMSVVAAVVLVLGGCICVMKIYVNKNEQLVEYVRADRSRSYVGKVFIAISAAKHGNPCYPVRLGVEVPLGTSCGEPSELVEMLLERGYLKNKIVCDAWGRPLLVRGLSWSESCDEDLVPREDCGVGLGSSWGSNWSPGFEVISLGADGVRSPEDLHCDSLTLNDTNGDIVIGFRGNTSLGPEPDGQIRLFDYYGHWFDRSGQKIHEPGIPN